MSKKLKKADKHIELLHDTLRSNRDRCATRLTEENDNFDTLNRMYDRIEEKLASKNRLIDDLDDEMEAHHKALKELEADYKF